MINNPNKPKISFTYSNPSGDSEIISRNQPPSPTNRKAQSELLPRRMDSQWRQPEIKPPVDGPNEGKINPNISLVSGRIDLNAVDKHLADIEADIHFLIGPYKGLETGKTGEAWKIIDEANKNHLNPIRDAIKNVQSQRDKGSLRLNINYASLERDLQACAHQMRQAANNCGITHPHYKKINEVASKVEMMLGARSQGISELDGTVNKKSLTELTDKAKRFLATGTDARQAEAAINIIDGLNQDVMNDKHLKKSGVGSSRRAGFDPTSFSKDVEVASEKLLNEAQKIGNTNPHLSKKIIQIADAYRAVADFHVYYTTENQKPDAALNAATKWSALESKRPGTGYSNTKGANIEIAATVAPVEIKGKYSQEDVIELNTDIDTSANLYMQRMHKLSAGVAAKIPGDLAKIEGQVAGTYKFGNYYEYGGKNHVELRAVDVKASKTEPGTNELFGINSKQIGDHRRAYLSKTCEQATMWTDNTIVNMFRNAKQWIDERAANTSISPDVVGRQEEGTIITAPGVRRGRAADMITDQSSEAKALKDCLNQITGIDPIDSGSHSKTKSLAGAITSKKLSGEVNGSIGKDFGSETNPFGWKAALKVEGGREWKDLTFYHVIAPHEQIDKLNKDPEKRLGWKHFSEMLSVAPQLNEYSQKYVENPKEITANFKTLEADFKIYSKGVEDLASSTAAILSGNTNLRDVEAMVRSMSTLNETFKLGFRIPGEAEVCELRKSEKGTLHLSELSHAIIGESFAAVSMGAAAVTLQEDVEFEKLDKPILILGKGKTNIVKNEIKLSNENQTRLNDIKASIDRCDFKSIDAATVHAFSPLILASDIATVTNSFSAEGKFTLSLPTPTKFEGFQKVNYQGNDVLKASGKPDKTTIDPLGQTSISASVKYSGDWFDRTHGNPAREGNYGRHKVDISLGISGGVFTVTDMAVRQIAQQLSDTTKKNKHIPKEERDEMVKQMDSGSFLDGLKTVLTELTLKGGGLPNSISLSWMHENHSACPEGEKKTSYSQFSASVSKGHDVALGSGDFGNPYPINVKIGHKDVDTFTVTSPTCLGSDLLMHTLRFADDVQPHMKNVDGMMKFKPEFANDPVKSAELREILFSRRNIGLLDLLEEASVAKVADPKKNTFSWLLQAKNTSAEGKVTGFIDADLRSYWFDQLSPFKKPADQYRLKEDLAKARSDLKDKTSAERLDYFTKTEVGQRLMDQYAQVIQFMKHCSGVASVDPELNRWKHVNEAASTKTNSLDDPDVQSMLGRAKKVSDKLNIDSGLRADIGRLARSYLEEVRKKPEDTKAIIARMNSNSGDNSAADQLADIMNSGSGKIGSHESYAKFTAKLEALIQLMEVKKANHPSMNRPEVQNMLGRLDKQFEKLQGNPADLEKIAQEANRQRGWVAARPDNVQKIIADMNNRSDFIGKQLASIMDSGSGGMFSSHEPVDKFVAKLEALSHAIRLKLDSRTQMAALNSRSAAASGVIGEDQGSTTLGSNPMASHGSVRSQQSSMSLNSSSIVRDEAPRVFGPSPEFNNYHDRANPNGVCHGASAAFLLRRADFGYSEWKETMKSDNFKRQASQYQALSEQGGDVTKLHRLLQCREDNFIPVFGEVNGDPIRDPKTGRYTDAPARRLNATDSNHAFLNNPVLSKNGDAALIELAKTDGRGHCCAVQKSQAGYLLFDPDRGLVQLADKKELKDILNSYSRIYENCIVRPTRQMLSHS